MLFRSVALPQRPVRGNHKRPVRWPHLLAALPDLKQAFRVFPRKWQWPRRSLQGAPREGRPLLPDIPALEPRLQPVILEEHLGYLALSGHMDRGLTILRRHAPWTARCGSATSLLSMLIGATVLLRQAVRAGRGGEPLGVELPESQLWCPGFNVPADFTLAQAAEACEAWARHLSELYDRRNGNTFFKIGRAHV